MRLSVVLPSGNRGHLKISGEITGVAGLSRDGENRALDVPKSASLLFTHARRVRHRRPVNELMGVQSKAPRKAERKALGEENPTEPAAASTLSPERSRPFATSSRNVR